MKAELEAYRRKIETVDDVAELRRLLLASEERIMEYRAREEERLKAEKEASLLFRQMSDELKGLREENRKLKEKLSHEAGQNTLKSNEIFGRQTEKTAALLKASPGEAEDPLSEDAYPDGESQSLTAASNPKQPEKAHKRGKRRKGKRAKDFSALPRRIRYEYDEAEIDRIYGKSSWTLIGWHETARKGYIPAIVYADITCTPVLAVGPGKDLACIPPRCTALPGSDATHALLAGVFSNKFSMHLPLNRQEGEFARFGAALSRQTMDNWVLRFSREAFLRVYEWMEKLLKKSSCTQSDETTLLVIRDGRSAGRKSFMWVPITSELSEETPIAVFCYEPDRSTDHLRQFYDDHVGQIICDAYCAYHTFEMERGGAVIVCGCWMHARRRWAESLRIRNVRGMTHEQIDALPEAKALRLIGDIYREDQKFKGKSAAERLYGRKTAIRQKVEAYFAFLKEFDLENQELPEKLRDAVSYSLNQKDYLTRFLNSGNTPIDNGACERRIRPFAVGRGNWLFCTSPKGAEATAIMYTLVETAKLNGANVYYYLKYLLENAPSPSMPPLSARAMNDLMPWSETYRRYEAEQKREIQDLLDRLSDEEPAGSNRRMRSGPAFLSQCG